MFSSVEIEVINRCNGICPFCPVNRNKDPRKLKKMDEKLFKKIMDELGEIHYSGRLALHSNNEPFLAFLFNSLSFMQYSCRFFLQTL